MKFILSVLILMLVLAVPISLQARDSSDGCGIGWEVNDDASFMGTSTRGTTNSTASPTFSMTSGTSGCDQHSIVKNEARGIHFAETNFANLMMEMSLGEGEFLAGFAEVMGCGEVETSFKSVMQTQYGSIFTSGELTPVEFYHNVLTEIKKDEILSSSCNMI